MKNKFVFPLIAVLLMSLACQFLSQPVANNNIPPTEYQETVLQPTDTPLPAEATQGNLTVIPDVEMVLVPAGEFIMGRDDTNEEVGPSHAVYLDAYYIDKYEVTNTQYRICVSSGTCVAPIKTTSNTHSDYFSNPEFDDYPVIYVNWDMAKTFCEWRGGNLPTEAQWEKAARGTDGRTYPWGEEKPLDETFGNFKYTDESHAVETGDTVPFGSYEKGVSPFGVYDMIGNVSEWVADWFSVAYYQNSPASNPLGPDVGECLYQSSACKVIRGGSWYTGISSTSHRSMAGISSNFWDVGFRCVNNVTP